MQLSLGRISFTLLTESNVSGGGYSHGRVHTYRYTCMSGIPFRISTFLDPIAYTYIHGASLRAVFYVSDFMTYIYIGRYFFFFRAVGSGRFECLSVSALIALARRCGGEHIILRDTYIYGIIYIIYIFFSSDSSSRARVFVYVCVYINVCVYVYIYVRPWLAFNISV